MKYKSCGMSQEFLRFSKINHLERDLYGDITIQKLRYFKVKKKHVLLHFLRKKNEKRRDMPHGKFI